MAMIPKPSLDAALALVADIVAQRKRWGASAGGGQYSLEQIVQAILVIAEEANIGGPTKADLTKLNRQAAASNAREAGYKKRIVDLEDMLEAANNIITRTGAAEALAPAAADEAESAV
jgi:hypothetical protein